MKIFDSKLKPHRIAAVPNEVLNVIVDTPVTKNVRVASLQVRKLEFQSAPAQDGSTTKVEVVKDIPTTSGADNDKHISATKTSNRSNRFTRGDGCCFR